MQTRYEQEDRLNALEGVPLFAELPPDSLQFLAERVIRKQLEPGQILFCEDEACKGLYIVESGLVKLYKLSLDGRERVLATQGPGSTLSELSLVDGGNYPSCAAALCKSTVLFLGNQIIQSICKNQPDCLQKVLGIVAERLRSALEIIEELSFATVRSRLATYLLRRLAKSQSRTRATELQLPGNQEIAAQIGTVRELVSRHLSRLQSEGVIQITDRRMRILDLDALTSEATGLACIEREKHRSL